MRSIFPKLIFLLVCIQNASAQEDQINHYRQLLIERQRIGNFIQDTGYIHILIQFANCFYSVDADSLLYYAQKGYSYSKAVSYTVGEAKCIRAQGNYFSLMGDYPKMLSMYQQSLSLAEKIKDSDLISNISMDIGAYYLDVSEYDKARDNYERAYRLITDAGDSLGLTYILTDMAAIYEVQKNADSALILDLKALQIATALKTDYSIAFIKQDLACILSSIGRFEEALKYFHPALNYYRQTGNQLGEMQVTFLLAGTYMNLGKKEKALTYAINSFDHARQLRNKSGIADGARRLSRIYERRGEARKSLYYFRIFNDYSDTLDSEGSRKQIIEQETKYLYLQKEQAMEEDRNREALAHSQHLKTLQLEVAAVIITVILLIIILFVLYNSISQKKANIHRLQAKNVAIAAQKEEIQRQTELLATSNKQKDRLFSIVAHDLKGPLNSLKSLLDYLKNKSLSHTEIANTINTLKNNVHYTADLVNNLLYWARNQMNGLTVNPSIVDVEEMSAGVLALFARQAAEKKIDMTARLDKGIAVYADKDMLQTVIRNLVSNAIKFCRAGDRITVGQGVITHKFVEVFVEDTGIGIKQDVLAKINNHETVTTFGTSSEKGTGLGLLLCKEFVEKNKGQFRIESQWGKGSKFHLLFPVNPHEPAVHPPSP